MNSLSHTRAWINRCSRQLIIAAFCFSCAFAASSSGAPAKEVELQVSARAQIASLHQEKQSRTPAQQKISSQILYHLRQKHLGLVAPGLKAFKPTLDFEPDGRLLVDMRGTVSPALLRFIKATGGLVVNSFERDGAIRALISPEAAELLAKRGDVRSVQPAARAITSVLNTPEAGDIAHRASEARQFFGTDGSGIKIGVLSDSIDNLSTAQASGALPSVTVLPGQGGSGAGEGTAILEIVHALAPGAQLYFASGLASDASFAQNIRSLRAAGCNIIIDDITYFNESPFQDGIIAQAVNDVSAAGALYFSSAGNSGGVDRGTSGTWEGDFKDAGAGTVGQGGRLHDFGGSIYNTVLPGVGFERLDLTWSDPLGRSTNDYDVYILDSSGNVVGGSADNQSGFSDPYESIPLLTPGQRIVIEKYAGVGRYLHLGTGRGHLTFTTPGTTFGHNASGATNAFCIAAARVPSPPAPFTGGSANPLENFSSDGPRHIFYNPDGTEITPGDLSSTGGRVLQKPDLTAADGVYTSLPAFSPFFGTSAAAPHAAAIAALVWSYNPFLAPAEIRSLLTSTALSTGTNGFDRNSGFGIAMAYPALAAAPQAFLHSVQLQDANKNGQLDPNECSDLVITLQNTTTQAITGISATLATSTPQVYVDPLPRAFPDLAPGQTAVSTVPFHISTGPGFVCGSNAVFRLEVSTSALGTFAQPFALSSQLAGYGNTNHFVSTNVPIDIPDMGSIDSTVQVSGIALPLAHVRVGVHITHTYDQDLSISLIAPDNTEVVLSANNGQSGENYGTDCTGMTFFSDDASSSISAASAPFVGDFVPEQPLSILDGKSGDAVNGIWRLRVADQAPQDVGTLQCWTMQLTPIGCFDGGGQCLKPPQLTQDLSDQVATNGDTVLLSVAADGTGPLSYQWFYNQSTALADQTNASLVLSNVTVAQAGTYQVVITNFYGSITSTPAALAVVLPAVILSSPTDQTATNGDTVTWTVAADGTPPLSYQWYFNLTNALPDATNATLVLTNVGPEQAGLYSVTISNQLGVASSTPANLKIVVLPSITCSPDATVAFGVSWDFSPPSFVDTNLTLQVLGTVTNTVCGESFSATRQWLVSDTNGYQFACSQTIQVLNTNPPLLSCAGDKTVIYGQPWNFDIPTARDALAQEALVYDNWTNALGEALDPGQLEVGNQITLAGTQRYPSRFALEYWGSNAQQAGFAGPVTAEVRFYQNDGPVVGGQASPGTVIYDSGPLAISATTQGALVIQEFALSAAVPLAGPLPDSFTWTVSFSGLGSNDAAGLSFYGPAVAGQLTTGYWVSLTNGWVLQGQNGFGGQIAALSSGASLSVVSTITNLKCAQSFTATRTWQAADACGNTNNCSQTVTVLDQSGPLVVSQPQDASALVGQTVTLSVQVSSCPPVGYQWYFNETNTLDQATNALLILSSATADESGSYQVVVTNLYGSITSAPAILTIAPPPVIDINPTNQVVTNGDTVQFTVSAHGTGNLSYQWFFDQNMSLPQGTNATLTLSNVNLAQIGTYQVVVSDAVGSVTSAPAHLQVWVTPLLVGVQGPVDIPDVGSIDSTVSVTGLSAPLAAVAVGVYITHTYDADLRFSLVSPDGTTVLLSGNNGQFGQNYGTNCNLDALTWFTDSATNSVTNGVAPFLGQFQPQQALSTFIGKSSVAANGTWTLHVEDTGPQDIGMLQCWSLQLIPQGCPADGGQCLTAPQIVQDISDEVVTNGMEARLSAVADGTQPLAYQWHFNVTNVISAATNSTLDLVNVGPEAAGTYQLVITNVYGSATSRVATLTVAVPPQIIADPTDLVATNGDTVTLQAITQGTAPLSYQWYFELTNALADATNSLLVLSNVSPDQAGIYDLVVANSFGSTTSAPAVLQVRVLPRITCSPDATVAFGVSWDFSPPSYVDTNLTLQVLGTVTNTVCGESFSATRQWLVSDTNNYVVTCSQTVQVLNTNPPLLSCAGDKTVIYGQPWNFDIPTARDALAQEGLVYDNWTNALGQALDPGQLQVGNQITLAGTQRYPSRFALEYWGTNAQQDGFAGSVTADVRFYQNDGPTVNGQSSPGTLIYDSGPLAVNATNRGALVIQDFGLSAVVPLAGPLPDRFTWTVSFSGLGSNDAAGLSLYGPPVTGQLTAGYWAFQTNGWTLQGQSGFGGQIAALSSPANMSVVSTVTNVDCAQSFTATRTWQATDACSNTSSCSQTVTVLDQSGPLVVSQPQDASALVGQTVTLSVQVSSCPPVGYRWYFNETNTLDQATNALLTLDNINTSEAGIYAVVITNDYGAVTTSVATVTVNVPAIIVGSPSDEVVTNGDDVHWRVLAKGSAPLFYQWFFNVTNVLPNQTNATLDLLGVTVDQAGVYQVVVTNLYGSATSAPAALTIVVAPTIVTDLVDQIATNGNTVSWSIVATGTDPLSYQWFFNSTVLGMETNATLVMSNVVPGEAGLYQVVVANNYGSVTSAPANLQVVTIPLITCSSDITVPLGSPWDFTSPSYGDTNLTLQVLGTTTNSLCGSSYRATRQWLVSDTNGFQVTCSQTVLVLDSSAPILSCPSAKTVIAGSDWSFDLPVGRESGATEAVVYDNWTNNLSQSFDPGLVEVGNQIFLDGTNRYPSRFNLEYWGTNATQSSFVGAVTARIRFYRNDGPMSAVTVVTAPGTLFYDSGSLPISATNQGIINLEEFQLSADVPLQGPLPGSFTWTVQFAGLGAGDAAGLNFYGPPVLGQIGSGYWTFDTNGWTLQGQTSQGFGGHLAAFSSGVNVTVLNTTTNIICAQTYTVTRNWEAVDACNNAATCGQTISVVNPSSPLITASPKDQSAVLNQTIQFSVGVDSCPPISYQWYFNGTNALSNGTNATLVLSNLTIDQAGVYSVVVANVYGSSTSAPAVLTISGAPVILTQPLDALVAEGGTATFAVSAESFPAPSYQWLFNDTNVLVGQTGPSLTLTNVQPSQGGFYSVVVSNSVGTVTSARANLAIVGAPVITLQPEGITNFQGQSVTFSVSANGTAPLSYQWLANCTRPISGATTPTLRLKSVGPTESGTYCVIVSNAFGSVLSQPAVLRVLVQPKLVSLSDSGKGAALSFSTASGLFYSVYFSDTLTNWALLPNMFEVLGTGAPIVVQDPSATGAQRYYRIRVE